MKVLVVESPAKAKTINKYLGKDYEVLASFGHIRDLPAKDGSVDPGGRFPHDLGARRPRRASALSDIASAIKGAEKLILATDPDREGEAISWHVLEALQREARPEGHAGRARHLQRHHQGRGARRRCASRAQIDQALVDAYLARRALDYLVGFNLSPVLWRKLPGRALGRPRAIGGAAPRLRPRARDRDLQVAEYWSLVATLATKDGGVFDARLVGADGKKITRLDIGNGRGGARPSSATWSSRTFSVANIEAKPAKRHPYPPFTTSTLQQEASRKLGLAPAQTMRVAQRLYEGVEIGGETVGLITYMRTDGVDMAPEAVAGGPPRDRQGIRRPLRAGRAAQIHDQGQERAGSARGRSARPTWAACPSMSRSTSSPNRRGSTN